jgi:nicotinamidase-related amidase
MSWLGRMLIVACMLLVIGGAVVVGHVQAPCGHTALVVIDVQNAWLRGCWPITIDGIDIVQKIAGILGPVRSAGIPVVFVIDVSMRGRYSESALALAEPLEVVDGDAVIEKTYPNAFESTSLGADLRAMGITTLLITGFASHACVFSTVNGALAQGFKVIIVEDAHSGGEGGWRASRMNDIWRSRGIQAVSSAEVLAWCPCLE